MSQVLLTGAAGFIGSRVARLLVADGYEVAAVVRPGAALHRLESARRGLHLAPADLDSPDDVRRVVAEVRPDLAYHLAWYTSPDSYVDSVDANIACLRSSLSLLRELLSAGCRRLVVTGTCAEYGLSSEPHSEAGPTHPRTMYGSAKLALAIAAMAAAAQTGAALTWARIFYLHGPGEDPRRRIPATILDLLAGRTVPVRGSDDVRDLLHVDDVAAALVALGASSHAGVANVCSGVPTTERRLLSVLAELTGGRVDDPGDDPGRPPSRTQGRPETLSGLGWRPAYDLAGGLADSVRWWKEGVPGGLTAPAGP